MPTASPASPPRCCAAQRAAWRRRRCTATLGDDLVALDLTPRPSTSPTAASTGMPHPGPLDAFAWTDRGIYRPGETVQVMALLRDAGRAARATSRPACGSSARTAGLRRAACRRAAADAPLYLPVAALASAPRPASGARGAGRSRRARRSAAREFRVDAFVPERLAVTPAADPGPLVPGQPLSLPVTARFLYGAPGRRT